MAVTIYSRYYGLDTVAHRRQESLAERPTPPLVDYPDSLVHVMVGGETLDQLAYSYYGREEPLVAHRRRQPRPLPARLGPRGHGDHPAPRVATRTTGR